MKIELKEGLLHFGGSSRVMKKKLSQKEKITG